MDFPSLFGPLKSKWVQICLGLLCILFVLLLKIVDIPITKMPLNLVNFTLYDLITSLNVHPYKEVTKIFIVDIDDYSIGKEGRWPWPRDKLATILSNLQNAGVVTVGVDIVMSNPEVNYALGLRDKLNTFSSINSLNPAHAQSQFDPLALQKILDQLAPEVDNDQILANALKNYDVTLGFFFHDLLNVQNGLLPAPLTNSANQELRPTEFNAQYFHGYNASLDMFIKASGHGGFVSNVPDTDDVVRKGLLLGSINNKVYASLSLMTTMRFLLADHVDLKTHKTLFGEKLYGLDIGGTFIPTTDKAEILIPFWGPPFTLSYIPATDLLQGNFDANQLAGGVAILGSSALMLGDYHPAPVSRSFPGVEMVGNMVSGMIGQQLITPFEWLTIKGAVVFMIYGISTALLLAHLGGALLIISTILLCAMLIGVDFYFYCFKNTYISMGMLFVLTLLQGIVNYLHGVILEIRQKRVIKQLFSQYVPETYVKELIASNASSSMEGETKELSVLFSDIRNFTSTSEGLDVVEVKRLLNTFLHR